MRLWNKKVRSEQTCQTILLRNVRMESSKRTVRRLWEIWLDVSLWPHQEPSALSAAGDHHRDLDLVKMNHFWTFYHKNKQLESKSTHCIQLKKTLDVPLKNRQPRNEIMVSTSLITRVSHDQPWLTAVQFSWWDS